MTRTETVQNRDLVNNIELNLYIHVWNHDYQRKSVKNVKLLRNEKILNQELNTKH